MDSNHVTNPPLNDTAMGNELPRVDEATFISKGQSAQTALSTEVFSTSEAPATPIGDTSISSVRVPQWMMYLENWRRYIIILFVCSSGLAVPVVVQRMPAISFFQVPAQQQSVSRADYERLELGMTLTDAQATLGRAIEVSRDETTATYKWANNDGSEITAVFKSNQLVSKEQSGLK